MSLNHIVEQMFFFHNTHTHYIHTKDLYLEESFVFIQQLNEEMINCQLFYVL